MIESLREPQLVPAEHCYVVLQDHGPDEGGWGPAAVQIPGFGGPRPFVYTGEAPHVMERVTKLCEELADLTGKPTMLARFTQRETVAFFSGSS